MLTVIDEFTRESPAIEVARRLRSDDVLYVLADLFVRHGPPDHIRVIRRGNLTPRIRGSQRVSAPISVKPAPRITNGVCRHGQPCVHRLGYR